MKIEKLPSGSYRIRKMYKGKTYTVITEYKPTQKEALQLLAEELDKVKTEHDILLFESAANKYIQTKENILSPSTIRSYLCILKNLSDTFKSTRISDMDQESVQVEINRYSQKRSPKSTRNAHGFISAVLSMYKPSLHLNTTLPQAVKRKEYIPTVEEVKKVLEFAKGTRYEIPFLLGTYGMRRSEICALTLDDIDGNTISINKALVQDKDNKWVLKSTKTTNSTRDIIVSDYLINLIHSTGTIYDGYPDKLIENLHSMQKKADVPRFRFHDLRHFFVTELSQAGFSEEDIMYLGGYSSPYVMKKVYRHARIDKDLEERKRAGERIAKILS